MVFEIGPEGFGNLAAHELECRFDGADLAGDNPDPASLGLVDDVRRNDLEHHLVAGQALEVGGGRPLADPDESVGRCGFGADRFLQRIALVFVQTGASLGVGLLEDTFDDFGALMGAMWSPVVSISSEPGSCLGEGRGLVAGHGLFFGENCRELVLVIAQSLRPCLGVCGVDGLGGQLGRQLDGRQSRHARCPPVRGRTGLRLVRRQRRDD